MAYNEQLAGRIRTLLSNHKGVTEKKMFGGISFMLGGNMCCGVVNDDMVIRISPGGYEKALTGFGARPMDFTGRPLRGFVYVGPKGRTDEALRKWVKPAVDFASSLPAKQATARKKTSIRRKKDVAV